jgi:hypothetical protein
MDCDDICSRNIKLNLLKRCLHRNDWDALSFNHPNGYYDTWALSKIPYVISCHHFKDAGQGQRLISNIIKKTPQYKLIKCLSAFNGFAIYRTKKFINCYYDTWALSKIPYVISCHHFKDAGQGQRYITNIIKKTPQYKLIKCLSAFNGFAIYRTKKFINCYYDGRFRIDYIPKKIIEKNIFYSGGILNTTKEDCEHRHFHIQAVLENNAKIRISPRCLFY